MWRSISKHRKNIALKILYIPVVDLRWGGRLKGVIPPPLIGYEYRPTLDKNEF